MAVPVHRITAWRAIPALQEADEAPWCGADRTDPVVAGHRTERPEHVTCPTCREQQAKALDGFTVDICQYCGATIGVGYRAFHLGVCDDCREKRAH